MSQEVSGRGSGCFNVFFFFSVLPRDRDLVLCAVDYTGNADEIPPCSFDWKLARFPLLREVATISAKAGEISDEIT